MKYKKYTKKQLQRIIFDKLIKHRKIFNNHIRECTTLEFYPHKITLDEFIKIIDTKDYYNETKKAKHSKYLLYIEEWVENFLSYLEIEEER